MKIKDRHGQAKRVFTEIPVIIEDRHEEAATILIYELSVAAGMPFRLRKARYGVDPSQYRVVLSLNGAYEGTHANVVHVTLPDRVQASYGSKTSQELLRDQMRDFASEISKAYFV